MGPQQLHIFLIPTQNVKVSDNTICLRKPLAERERERERESSMDSVLWALFFVVNMYNKENKECFVFIRNLFDIICHDFGI